METVREPGIDNVDGACGISRTLGALSVLSAEIPRAESTRTGMVSLLAGKRVLNREEIVISH